MAEVNVGAIKVTIGGDTFELKKARKDSAKQMSGIAKDMDKKTKRITAIAKRMGLAVAAAMAALTLSIKNALTKIDELGNMAQSLGLTVEQLTQIKFAASQASIGLDTISIAMNKLLANAKETDPLSEGVTLFRGLGVAAKDSSGRIRNLQSVMIDLSDKFSRMNDSAEKTRLAMRLFGERAGPKMVPFLNLGSEAIRDLIAKSDALGITLDTKTVAAVAAFNAKIERVKAVLFAVSKDITNAALPSLNRLADSFLSLSSRMKQSVFDSEAVQFGFRLLEIAVEGAMIGINAIIKTFQTIGAVIRNLVSGEFKKAWQVAKDNVADYTSDTAARIATIRALWNGWISDVTVSAPEFPKHAAPIIATAQDIAKSFAEAKQSVTSLIGDMLASDITPFTEKFKLLGDLLRQGRVEWREFGQAWKEVSRQQSQATSDLVSETSNALGAIFSESKGIAIAQAIINTYQGITKALATYPPPLSYGFAAAQAAFGFAQVAKIKGTGKDSQATSSVSSSGGGASAPTDTQQQPQQVPQTLTVEGIDPNAIFSGGNVRGLVDELLQFQRDGGRVILA